MGETHPDKSNDINITLPIRKGNDNVVGEAQEFNYSKFLKGKVREKISEYKLSCFRDFLFGHNLIISDCGAFINPAIKQLEHFMYCWMNELDDDTRKIIVWHTLNGMPHDSRSYADFTNSALWKYESSLYKVKANFTCSVCEKQYWPTYLVVHHLSYEHLGSEFAHPEDVTVLCKECHKKVHGLGGDDEQK